MSKGTLELTNSKRGKGLVGDLVRVGIPKKRSLLLANRLLRLSRPDVFAKRIGMVGTGRQYKFTPKRGGSFIVIKDSAGVLVKSPGVIKLKTKGATGPVKRARRRK